MSACEDSVLAFVREFMQAPPWRQKLARAALRGSLDSSAPAATSALGEPVCTIQEATRLLGCSERLPNKLFHSGKLEGYRVGSRILIFVSSIREYVDRQRNAKPPADPQSSQPAASSDPEPAPKRRKQTRRPASTVPGGFRYF